MPCRICLQPAPAGTDECAACESELAEQLERMDAAPRRRRRHAGHAEAAVPIPPEVADIATSPLKDVIVAVHQAARRLDGADRADIGQAAVAFARATGWRRTQQALIELAAVAVKFGARLGPTSPKDANPPSGNASSVLAAQVPVRLGT